MSARGKIIAHVASLVLAFGARDGAATARAQPQPPARSSETHAGELPELTLAELEALALDNHPALRQAEARVDARRGLRTQAGLYPNPVVGYEGGEIGNRGRAGMQGGFISQEIVTAGKRRYRRAVAHHEVEQAQWLLDAQRLRILTAVRTRYYEVLAAQRRVELARDLIRIAEDGQATARTLVEVGEGTRADVLQAEIELHRAQIVANNSQQRSKAAWRRLAAAIGDPELQAAQLQGSLENDIPNLDWEETRLQWLHTSPELQQARVGVRRADDAVKLQRAQAIPNVHLQVGIQRDAETRDTITGVQVGIPLPIFDRNQGNVRAAFADVRRAQGEVQRIELALYDRLAALFERYERAQGQVDHYQRSILLKARESLDLTIEGYRNGQFDFLQVLTAQRTYFETHLDYLEILAQLWQSVAEIRGLLSDASQTDPSE